MPATTDRLPAAMTEPDFTWAAELMARRRALYATYSPVFWRPAQNVEALHARFLGWAGGREGAVALRSEHGFVVSFPQAGCCFVDDFAVEDPASWNTEGRLLLLAAWRRARGPGQSRLRVVTARQDVPKRSMLIELGLIATERWWVKELTPTGPAHPLGPLALDGSAARLVQAPPVYDPGGPVCLLGSLEAAEAASAAERAAAAGAVLAVVQRGAGGQAVPEREPQLEAAGYHNTGEFFEGEP